MKEHSINKEDIESIHIVHSAGCRCTTEPLEEKQNPPTPEAAMFSNPYVDTYTEETFQRNMANPEFVEYMKRFIFAYDPSITTAFDNYPITITLRNGQTFSKVEASLPGNQQNPVTWEQVIQKFQKSQKFSAVDLGQKKYKKVIEICRNMENIDDMRCLVQAITP